MLETVSQAINHLFDSVHCTLLPKTHNLYSPINVLIVWELSSGFIVKLKTDGYLYYSPDKGVNTYEQFLYSPRELNELINYYNN